MPEGQHYLAEPRPTRPRAGTAALAAAVVVLLAVGAAGLGLVHRHGSSSNGAARATVMASVSEAFAHKTALATLHLTVNPSQITGSGTAQIDFTRGAMSMRMTARASGVTATVNLIYAGGTLYEQIPGVSHVAPGKSWVSIDLSSLVGGGAAATSALGGGNNPLAMLQLLTQQGAAVSPAGTKTVDGVTAHGYRVDISPAVIQKQLASAHLPAWMRQAVASVGLGRSTENVYLDQANQLRQFELSTALTTQGITLNVAETIDFSHYGTPVTVTAPPASQVISMEQYLKLSPPASGAD